MKHTPAPWKVNEKTATVYVTRKLYGEIDEPAICKAGDTLKFEESLANAALIAAAPELLEALRELLQAVTSKGAVDYYGPITWSGSPAQNRRMFAAIDEARAAIAKAEGNG